MEVLEHFLVSEDLFEWGFFSPEVFLLVSALGRIAKENPHYVINFRDFFDLFYQQNEKNSK